MTDREPLLDELRPVAFAIAYRMLGGAVVALVNDHKPRSWSTHFRRQMCANQGRGPSHRPATCFS